MAHAPPWPKWIARWQRAVAAARRRGAPASSCGLAYDAPATPADVEGVERELGARIPEQFRRTLLEFSRRVEVYWFLPPAATPPGELAGIFCGVCTWDLGAVVGNNDDVAWLSRNVFVADTPDERCWHSKFAFHSIPCGDYLAIDTRGGGVVYLGHELDGSHGCWLGADFFDFMDRWTALGCPDDNIWPRFVADGDRYIDLSSDNARRWVRWFGIPPADDEGATPTAPRRA